MPAQGKDLSEDPGAMSKNADASRNGSRRHSSKGRKEKMSTLVLLTRAGLEEYYEYFEKAGYKMFDGNAHPSDMQVEQILADTERICGISFVPEVRVQLWKAIRYQWFRGPGHIKPFIERSQIPGIFLPKRDYKQVDWNVRMSEIDPERQRQIIRKTRPSDAPAFRGPAVTTMQFEVFKRQGDLWYEFKDLERGMNEWQNRNPRTMLREDPREETMKLRIKNIEEQAAQLLAGRRQIGRTQKNIYVFLWFLRMTAVAMAYLMWATAYYRYRNSPRALWLPFIAGSNQFICGIVYFLAYMFVYAVAARWHADPMAVRLQRLLHSCQRLQESISDYRVETEAMRTSPTEVFEDKFLPSLPRGKQPRQKKPKGRSRDLQLGEGEGEARKRPKKKKADHDEAFNLWVSKERQAQVKEDAKEADGGHVQLIQKAIEDSYKRLPELAQGIRRPGGNRMMSFAGRMGMPEGHEDKLCIRLPPVPQAPALPGLQGMPPQMPHGLALPMPKSPSLPAPPSAQLQMGSPMAAPSQVRSSRSGSRSPARRRSSTTSLTMSARQAMASTFPGASGSAAVPEEDAQQPPADKDLSPWLPGYMPPGPDEPPRG